MITYDEFVSGLAKFIDMEIIPKMSGFRKLAFGVGSGIALKKSEEMFNLVRDNKLIHTLGILDNNNHINIDLLKEEIESKMGGEVYEIEVPMIGVISLDKNDLNKLYSFMRNR